jgi:hypothetical protein
VVEINVDDDQVEDRIDEAFEFYREFHYDSVELVYYKAQVTASVATLDTNVANTFAVGQIIVGSTSGSMATILNVSDTNVMNVWHATGPFVSGETLTAQGGPSATGNVVFGSFDNKYFTVDDTITGVNRILQLSNKANSSSMFDVRYQLLLNNIQSLTNTDIIYYSQLKTHLQLINDLLTGQKPIQFNRHMNRLFVDMDWNTDVMIGDYVIAEAYKILDPDQYTLVYDDYFLKRYATALIKRQWGINLKKFEGVQLPGGVVLNGQKIFDEAQEELTALRQTAQDTYQLPVDFFTG